MQISDLFDSFNESAFRLEGLSEYSVPEEAAVFHEFRTTGSIDPTFNSDWTDLVAKNTAAGKTMSRLRLLSKKLTDYERFELITYRTNVAAGEDIRFSSIEHSGFENDFWVFDLTWIAVMKYDRDGAWRGADVRRVNADDTKTIRNWLEVFSSASSVPPR
jgi:hypothetical protein